MQGVRLYEKGELYGATEQFQKAMMNNPDDANAYYNMASTLHRMGTADKNPNSLQQAETLYNECLNRDPNHAACYRGLAVLLAQTDRSDKAFVLLKNWAIRESTECRRAGRTGAYLPGVWRHQDGRTAVAAGTSIGPDKPASVDRHGLAARIERRLPTGSGQLSTGLCSERLQPCPCQPDCGT